MHAVLRLSKMSGLVSLVGLLGTVGLGSQAAWARNVAPPVLCKTYPDSALCAGQLPACSTCHTSTWPAAWNDFGLAILARLDGPLEDALPGVLADLADEDSDHDGMSNVDEIQAGTSPGDPLDAWRFCVPGPAAATSATGNVPVDPAYDFALAYRRALILYCGRSPTFDEVTAFPDAGADRQAAYQKLHDTVDTCIAGAYWRDQGLPRLADRRIRPVSAVGADSPIGITIADYSWDYRLFVYVMTGDRDVRDLLLADYHVQAGSDGTLVAVQGTIPSLGGGNRGQPLVPQQRAGMITTQWFLALNTMFSPLPRTTAAQAYRAYLGFDIARQQGLFPVAGEPVDVDQRGVAQPECAVCHSTLDPLSYAFASYQGVAGASSGVYDPGRPARLIPGWSGNQAMMFGQPVAGVREWAVTATESDAFARDVAVTFFRHAVEREPGPGEAREFEAIWRAMPDEGWSANKVIHHIIDTRAFGVRP